MKLSQLIEAKEVELAASVSADLQKLVDKHQLEQIPKFKKTSDGWNRLVNSSLLVDERSDEGGMRKSAIQAALKKHGFEVDWRSNIFQFR